MQEYGETTEQQKAVGAWLCDYAEHRQPFDEIKHRHTLNEVGDVAEGRYDWKIEREDEVEVFQCDNGGYVSSLTCLLLHTSSHFG